MTTLKHSPIATILATLICLSGPVLAQNVKTDGESLIVDDVSVTWIEKSNVSALREGVIDRMELQIGMAVTRDKPIGYLHSEIAELSIKKAEIAAKSVGPLARAEAQKENAAAKVARNQRLNERIKGAVSDEDMQRDQAELKVAAAMIVEEQEKILLSRAELDLAKRALLEHTIVAPFDGIVIERMKNPGESVRANEAVVKLGNLNRLRVYGYVPVDFAYRVKEGQIVEFQPRLSGSRSGSLPVEQKRFRGKLTFVDPEIQPIGETAVRIYAEFDNSAHELRPGLKGRMTIYLNSSATAAQARADAGIGR